MKQVPSDKYTVAWFKLADCISRGEKERAFGVYRLLSHSIDDSALVIQLEGDMLLAFNEIHNAIKKYTDAACLYKKQKRLLQAVGVYEHLILLDPQNKQYHIDTINLYTQLSVISKIKKHQEALLQLLVETQDLEALADFMQDYQNTSQEDVLHIRQIVVCALLACNYNDEDLIRSYLHEIIDQLLLDSDQTHVTRFLSKLKAISDIWYEYVCEYVKNNNNNYKPH